MLTSHLPTSMPSSLPAFMPAAHAIGAGRLFTLIIVVFLAILAAFIVPFEVRLRRQRRSADRETAPRATRDEV